MTYVPLVSPAVIKFHGPRFSFLGSCRCRRFTTKVHEPLRILFCGSDAFSVTSLQALDREKKLNSGLIASIDVVCRPPKLVRRNRKAIREGVPAEYGANTVD